MNRCECLDFPVSRDFYRWHCLDAHGFDPGGYTSPNRGNVQPSKSPFAKPDVSQSFQQFQRFHHQDLSMMSNEDIRVELWALRSRLYRLPEWFRQRVRALESEVMKRRSNNKGYSHHQQETKLSQNQPKSPKREGIPL